MIETRPCRESLSRDSTFPTCRVLGADSTYLAGSNAALDDVLSRLAARRPLFHSEADFQFALAWQIHELDTEIEVRLESRPKAGIHLDVELRRDGRTTALELKYLTRRWSGEVAGERFDFASGVTDLRRYDVVKDLARVEDYVAARPGSNGAVVVLASDPIFWKLPDVARAATADDAFRIHDGAALAGELVWGPTAGPGTTRSREAALVVKGMYPLAWRQYSSDPLDLRVLVVEVPSARIT